MWPRYTQSGTFKAPYVITLVIASSLVQVGQNRWVRHAPNSTVWWLCKVWKLSIKHTHAGVTYLKCEFLWLQHHQCDPPLQIKSLYELCDIFLTNQLHRNVTNVANMIQINMIQILFLVICQSLNEHSSFTGLKVFVELEKSVENLRYVSEITLFFF